ncbi:MAG: YraN family protein [Candidatus Spechtbacterales bacterium]
MDKDSLGFRAEEAAARSVKDRGWRILERNFAKPWGEVDIIARDGAVLVCIEVKAGYTRDGFSPEDHFDARKRDKVTRACHAYALHNGFSESECRVDLASVVVDPVNGRTRVHYYKNAGS